MGAVHITKVCYVYLCLCSTGFLTFALCLLFLFLLFFCQDDGEKKVDCRLDWHQTGSHVTISVFAKVAQPSKTWVEVNKVAAKINIVFDGGKSQFQKEVVLRGVSVQFDSFFFFSSQCIIILLVTNVLTDS